MIIGLIITFLILFIPIYALIVAVIIGRPRMFKVSGLFLASLGIVLTCMIVLTWAFGIIMSLFIPG